MQLFIALGANASIGGIPLEATLTSAIGRLSEAGVRLRRTSSLFRTPCFPPGAGPDFVNAVVEGDTGLPPESVLAGLHRLEADFGRTRQRRWGARTLDLDLVSHGTAVCPDAATFRHWAGLPADRQATEAPDRLILPHPRLQDRAFVLVPMAQIAPGWRHPVTGLTVAAMLGALAPAARDEIVPL